MSGWNHHDLASRLESKRQSNGSYKAKCLTHKDPVGSLLISAGSKGQAVIVNCKAGCDKETVWKACCELMGGKPTNTPPEDIRTRTTRIAITPAPVEAPLDSVEHYELGKPTSFHEYRDLSGALHFYVCRFDFAEGTAKFEKYGRKTMRPYTYRRSIADGREGWFWAGPDKGRIPYRLNLLGNNETVMLSEGEKAADAAAELLPEIAHISPYGGADALVHTDWTQIAGKTVYLLPDADRIEADKPNGASVKGMDKLAPVLDNLGCNVQYCRNVHDALRQMGLEPDQFKGFDAADALKISWPREKFLEYITLAGGNFAQSGKNLHAISQNLHGGTGNFPQSGKNFPAETEIYTPPTENFSNNGEICAPAAKNFANSGEISHGIHEISTCDAENFSQSITAELKKSAERGLPFLALGFDQDNYFYLSKKTRQVKTISAANHKKQYFFSMVSNPTFWESFVPTKKTGADWDMVMAKLMEMCHDAGLFTPDMKRGRGAWWDNDHVVLHLGNRLIIDGVEHDILTRPGSFVYELAQPMQGPGLESMTDDESRHLLEVCKMFSWESPISATYLAGWVALAPVCGALDWRPHIWVTGAKGTGKSTIEDKFLMPLLGNMVKFFQGASTAAGIRQTLKIDALPVLIDESESKNERGRTRIEDILELMTQASSSSGSKTVKGGASGTPNEYDTQSMFCLASIGVTINNAAIQSRVTKLILVKSDASKWPPMKEALRKITLDTSKRLIARIVRMIPTIRHNINLLSAAVGKVTGDQRLGDQYGTLLAGAVALEHSRELTPDEATAYVMQYESEFSMQAHDIDEDQDQCLKHLLQQTIKVDGLSGSPVTLSVGELIDIVRSNKPTPIFSDLKVARATLSRHGIRATPYERCIQIARTHTQLSQMFRGTPWQAGWAQFLLRVEGGHKPLDGKGKDRKFRFGGSAENAVELTLPELEDESSAQDTMPF